MSNQILSQNNQILNNNNSSSTTINGSIAQPAMMIMNTTSMSFPSNTKINQIVSMSPSSNNVVVSSSSSSSASNANNLTQISTVTANPPTYSISSPSSTTTLTTTAPTLTPSLATTATTNSATLNMASNVNNSVVNNNNNNLPSSPNITNGSSNTNGFANCSHCGSNGVKAAFYGKSKLYCSVACQNGKRNPQHGIKRTIEALNYNNNGQTQTISVLNQTNQLQPNNPISISSNSNIPSLIPTNSFYTISTDASNLQGSNIFQTLTPANQQHSAAVFNTIQTSTTATTNLFNSNGNNNNNNIISNTVLSDVNGKLATIKSMIPHLSALSAIDNLNKYQDMDNKQNIINSMSIHQHHHLVESSGSSSSGLDNNNFHQEQPAGTAAKRARKTSTASSGSTNSKHQTSSTISNTITSTIDEVLKKNSIEIQSNESNGLHLPPPPVQNTTKTTASSTKIKNIYAEKKIEQTIPSPAQATTTPVQSNFDWPSYLEEQNNAEAASVSFFKHVPLCNFWNKIRGIVVEAPTKYSQSDEIYYWFAIIIKYSGYFIKLRYVGFKENETADDFWMHIGDPKIHHVGYAKSANLNLAPPEKINEREEDWKAYLFSNLPKYATLPKQFHTTIVNSLKSSFERNMLLELVDKQELSKTRLAKIIENIGGRLRLKYENTNEFNDFWCHKNSSLIHPIGWSATVGHDIVNVSEEYKRNSLQKYLTNKYERNECSKDMFNTHPKVDLGKFKVNMKLEAIDPIEPARIRVATITKLLGEDYLMVKLDKMKCNIDRSIEFCYHRTSSSIFHPGFSRVNNIGLEKPFEYPKKIFSWEKYLSETTSEYAPEELFFKGKNGFMNPFKIGMKLESVDLVEPRLLCPATVVAIAGRLIRISFDGWGQEMDQWIDCESCDLYPIGWCQLVNYQLELPQGYLKETENQVQKKTMKKTSKKNK